MLEDKREKGDFQEPSPASLLDVKNAALSCLVYALSSLEQRVVL